MLCSFVVFSLLPARSQNANVQVPQGGSATFDATSARGPSSGCEILDPSGAVVVSFPGYSSGGSANGWTLQVNLHNYNALPGFTVSAPSAAPLGAGYQVRTASYYWLAGTAFFDVVAGNTPTPTPTPTSATPTPTPTSTTPTPTPTSATPTPTPTPTPTTAPPLQLDAQIRLAGADDDHWNGSNVTNSDGSGQSEEQITCAGKAAVFEIGIQNKGSAATSFKLKSVDSGNAWTMRYFDAPADGNEITAAVVSANGWDTPSVAPSDQLLLRVEVTPGAAASRDAVALVKVLDSAGSVIDAVRALAFRQSLARAEVSVDMGETWQTVTPAGVTKALYGMVGFRAFKGDETLDWPYFPYEADVYPHWDTQNTQFFMNPIWVRCNSLADIPVAGVCGNSIITTIHVIPRN